jgi:uncharacterized protein HemY
MKTSRGFCAPDAEARNSGKKWVFRYRTRRWKKRELQNEKYEKNSFRFSDIFLYEKINRLFRATAQATEEAILNAMVAAEAMKGYNGNTAYALPRDRLKEILKKYNRPQEVKK